MWYTPCELHSCLLFRKEDLIAKRILSKILVHSYQAGRNQFIIIWDRKTYLGAFRNLKYDNFTGNIQWIYYCKLYKDTQH